MDIPRLAQEQHGGKVELYKLVYKYSSAFMTDEEIAGATGENENTIRAYRAKLKKTIATLPPDEMTTEALYGYINMSDMMLEDMMQVYLEMREDRDIFRNNTKTTDGKRRLPVHSKDMIALMQTLMKTQLERAAVMTKFAAVKSNANVLPTKATDITAHSLMDSNADVTDVEFKEFKN